MAEELGIRFLGEIPIDVAVREGGDTGAPIVAARPDSPAAKAFAAIAGQVAAQIAVRAMRIPLKVVQTA
jgi:ATP-binding protein involved in chromosome partitioning